MAFPSGTLKRIQFSLFFVSALIVVDLGLARETTGGMPAAWELAQSVSFDSWRPYKNPNKLVREGMNKGEVLAIDGEPDYLESYDSSVRGRRTRISDWYYVRTGVSPETTLLKFVEETLVSITSTPTQ